MGKCRRDIAALLDFINSRQNVPHVIGRDGNDCFAYIIGAVEAQTGKKVAPKLKWKSLAGGRRILKRFGSAEAALDAHFKRIPPAFAMRGDIAGVPDETFGIHPAIVEGNTLVGPGDRGNKRFPRRAMVMAWSVTDE